MQSPCYCIVMEYCPYGQLYEVLRDGKDIPPTLLVSWTKQIATGMSYLHTHKIIHRDLKSPKLVSCCVVSVVLQCVCVSAFVCLCTSMSACFISQMPLYRLWHCKNRLSLLPGQMSYNTTTPGFSFRLFCVIVSFDSLVMW